MICFPNAKINLGLNIVSRRQDGYHNLETIFYPIGLQDALEIVPTLPEVPPPNRDLNSEIGHVGVNEKTGGNTPNRFFQTGDVIHGNNGDNLVIRALQLISNEKELPPLDIHLFKKIPSGAGLGGGSSDAAAMLRIVNDSFRLCYTDQELAQLAAKLGADCPFFLFNRPAFATGIGDELESLEVDIDDLFCVLVKPDISIPTKEAYAMITPRKPELSLKEIVKKPITEWKELMKNDFEPSVFEKYPQICRIKQQLYERGALYASMSGSGSSVYGFFRKEQELKELRIMFDNHFIWTNKER
jgi:4-diphosphocytidyl-2-C-methyl-D-erythritol kinase